MFCNKIDHGQVRGVKSCIGLLKIPCLKIRFSLKNIQGNFMASGFFSVYIVLFMASEGTEVIVTPRRIADGITLDSVTGMMICL